MLARIADDLWTATQPQRFWGLETGTRMNVVRLRDGSLFIHCPIHLDPALRREIDALGPVSAVVSSSLYHHLYVSEWVAAYPDAVFCASPGLERKRSDLPWRHILGDEPHPLWKDQIEQVFFSARFEKEVVFFHRESRTMLTADALLNLFHHPSRLTRTVAFLMGNTAPGKGYLERIAVRDWKTGRRQVDRMLEWNINRILLAHGAAVESNGRDVLREAYSWL